MEVVSLFLRHLGELLLLALSSWAWGRLLILRLPCRDAFERGTLACAAGIGLLGSLLHVLGLLGGLTRPAVLALLTAPLLALPLRLGRAAGPAITRRDAVILALGLAPAFLLALYPPTAFDATLYHLPTARAFAEQHAVSFLPTLRFPVFPQLMELLFAAALSVSGDVVAQLVHFLCLALAAALVLAWGRRFGAERVGLWAAAAFLGNPLLLSVGASANVDVGLALFAGAATFAWWVWRENGDVRWLVWCGIFTGFAASTKYTGLFLVAALPVATLLARRTASGVRAALGLTAVTVLVALPFYARIVADTGNPLFPYFSRFFGTSAWDQPYDPAGAGPASATVLATRATRFAEPLRLLGVPLRLVTPGGGLGKETIYSPWNLLLAPLLFWPGLTDRRTRPLVLLAGSYAVLWYLAIPDRRYLFLVVPAAMVVEAAGLDRLASRKEKLGSAATVAVALLLLSPSLIWSGRALWKRGALPSSPSARDAYLARVVPVYPALRALNETYGDRYTAYGFYCESAAYFCRGRFLGDHFGPYRYALVAAALADPRSLHEVLRSFGATHLLAPEPAPSLPKAAPDFSAWFQTLPAPAGVRLYALRTPDGLDAPGTRPPISSRPESDRSQP